MDYGLLGKAVVLGTLATIGGAARASYDLALIMDVTNQQILRFDPVSGQALGAFGRGQLGYFGNASQLTLDPFAPGTVLATDVQGFARRFDYSTGRELGTLRLQSSASIPFFSAVRITRAGHFLATSSALNRAAVYDRTTGAEKFSLVAYGGYTTLDAVELEDGSFASLERRVSGSDYLYSIFRRDASGVFTGWASDFFASTSSTEFTRLALRDRRLYATGGGAPNVYGFDLPGTSTVTGFSMSFTREFGTSMTPVVFGHGSAAYFLLNKSSGNASLYRVDTVADYYRKAYDSPYSQQLGDMVMVVAPEPGTMAALGLGLAVLVRRRRR